MTGVEAWVDVLDTQTGYRFTRRFAMSPIRIGRALVNNICLQHRGIANVHCEISIGPRAAYFRSQAWLKKSWVDGIRVTRGRSMRLNQESVLTIGSFELRVVCRIRDRRYERERKVTPLALARLPGWNGAWSVDRIGEPYAMIETSRWNADEAGPKRVGSKPANPSLSAPPALKRSRSEELARRLADPRASLSVLDDIDQDLTKVAAHVAREFQARERARR